MSADRWFRLSIAVERGAFASGLLLGVAYFASRLCGILDFLQDGALIIDVVGALLLVQFIALLVAAATRFFRIRQAARR